MQMIPGGDMIEDDERVQVERILPTRNRLYSKVKGKPNFQNYKKTEKIQSAPYNLTQKTLVNNNKTITEKS